MVCRLTVSTIVKRMGAGFIKLGDIGRQAPRLNGFDDGGGGVHGCWEGSCTRSMAAWIVNASMGLWLHCVPAQDTVLQTMVFSRVKLSAAQLELGTRKCSQKMSAGQHVRRGLWRAW